MFNRIVRVFGFISTPSAQASAVAVPRHLGALALTSPAIASSNGSGGSFQHSFSAFSSFHSSFPSSRIRCSF